MKEKMPGSINPKHRQEDLESPLSHRAVRKTVEAGNDRIEDEDVHSPTRGNAEFIKENDIEILQETVEIKEEKFLINIFFKQGPKKQKYLVIHDSEDAAFDTGIRAIKKGGALIALENKNKRNLHSFGEKEDDTGQDPNRIFDKDSHYYPLARKILKLLGESSGEMVIALHNNKQDGDFSLDNLEEQKNISILSKEDPDPKSMILIPGPAPKPDPKTYSEIQYYQDQGLNVVYEYIPKEERGDGSLSNYAAKNGLIYRNLEVPAPVRGDQESEAQSLKKQTRYLNAVKNYHSL